MLTYRKTKQGDWAVFGPANELSEGPVTVTKKDGSTKAETVRRVSKSFEVDGVPHAYGFLTADDAGGKPTTSTPRCRHCGKAMRSSQFGDGFYCPDKACRDAHKRKAETKTCWECGCTFTYADAKRNGGDWSDSYCGC